jgi:predicted Ser/Thr protein kinase
MNLQVGQTIGSYRLEKLIASGAFGQVWLGRHKNLPEKQFAVKISSNPAFVEFLRHEAGLLRRLDHLHIVRLVEFNAESDPPFLVMEYVEGRNLRRHLERGAMSIGNVIRLFAEIVDGLAYAHAQGVVHGDLKPENVLLDTEEKPRLVDFGLAKDSVRAAGSALLSLAPSTSSPVGTLPYMAPEVREGRTPDYRSDVYSCGILLFELLTGRRPEGRELPGELRANLAPELNELYDRCVARHDERYSDASALLAGIHALPQYVRMGYTDPAVAMAHPDGVVHVGGGSPVSDSPEIPVALFARMRNFAVAAAIGLGVLLVWFFGDLFSAWPKGTLLDVGVSRFEFDQYTTQPLIAFIYWMCVAALAAAPIVAHFTRVGGRAGGLAAAFAAIDVCLAGAMLWWGPTWGLIFSAAAAVPALVAVLLQTRDDLGFSRAGAALLTVGGIWLTLAAMPEASRPDLGRFGEGLLPSAERLWWHYPVLVLLSAALTFIPSLAAAVFDSPRLRGGRFQVGLGLCLLSSMLIWGPLQGVLYPLVPLTVIGGILIALDLL